MSSCNLTQNILETECIGDSLTKITGNFSSLDTAVCDLTDMVNQLKASQTFTQIETVIGPTATLDGAISATTKAQGNYTPPSVNRLADFRWEKADGTIELVRMETVTLSTYAPWQHFFPYKPSGNIKSTKFLVSQPVADTTSLDLIQYTFYVDWINSLAWFTGYYYEAYRGNPWVFNKKWNFSSGQEIIILSDNTLTYPKYNQLGERPGAYALDDYSGNGGSPMKAQISPTQGILQIPVWFYSVLNETAHVSIFIENTFFVG